MLRRDGYEFVSVSNLLGTPADSLMPRVAGFEHGLVAADRSVSWILACGWWLMMKLFLLTTAFALVRSLLLGMLVYKRSRRAAYVGEDFEPAVLLLIPAYNEEKVIRRTLDAALSTDYPNFRIVVVDDGSTDGTAAAVADVARIHLQVELICKPNGGKFSALNLGFNEAWEQYIVTIDADTIILPDTVRRLVARFANPTVDAVCGNVLVGNRDGLLTQMQDAEYVTSQNYDRRAFDAANCIPVVPGACGAWRRRAVLRAGGYSSDTLTEDADLTLTMLCGGAKIVYEPLARARTEAPRNTAALLRQRFRWGYGTFQSLWKHRRHFARGSVGWIALPNLLLFQVIFPALAPLSLLVVAVSLLRGAWLLPLIWFLVFVVVDLAGAAVAFLLEKRSLRDLWVVMAQRFYYRPFMYVITLRSLLAALRGSRHGWNKLDRHATVQVESRPLVAPAPTHSPRPRQPRPQLAGSA
jgi:cellulose synthase/poly-beta-1,6-N-acetylglucosamine synthase-like glycosyltransferase